MKKIFLITCLLSLTFGVLVAAGGNGDSSPGSRVLVEIDGVKLTLANLEAKRPASLFQARNTFHEAERKAVEEFINDYLLERQAQKEKVTAAELLERHVNSAVAQDPSEEALRIYYEGVDTKEPYEAVRDKILDAIRQRRIAKAKTAYLETLRSQAKVVIRLSPPRAQVSLKGTPVRGLPNAPVVLVEYADYECPYCQQIQPVLDKLVSEYKDRVAFAYKDVPLPMHTHAQKAAEAAHCAGVQGKYWEYHDLLFKSKDYETPKLKDYARSLKLNGEAFDTCLDSGQQAERVKTHLAEAQALGLPGTPAFFVNGRIVPPTGPINYQTLRQLIEEELRVASGRARGGIDAQY